MILKIKKTSLVFSFFSVTLWAAMPSDPVSDPNFMTLPNGKSLSSISVNGVKLSLAKGAGSTFGSSAKSSYLKLKTDSQNLENYKVQWVFKDLTTGEVVAQSRNPDKRIFGASSSKIFVGGALLDKQQGTLSSSQLQLMANMIVVSSNTAWTDLQRQIGDGSADKGRERNYAFTQRLGYEKTHGFQGWWGNLHGNELTAHETADFLMDTYNGEYPGAEYLWKLMYTCRTGSSRARKYLPTQLLVGGKTGTYDGPTFDSDIDADVSVKIRNHVITYNANGHQYGLVVLANSGSDESAALIAAGLYYEYIAVR